MGIRSLISKLLELKKEDIFGMPEKKEISDLPEKFRTLYAFPLKEDYLKEAEDLEAFESYKEEYLRFFSQRKHLTSISVISNDLKKKQDDLIKFIMNIMKEDVPLKIDIDKKIDLLVAARKLALYFQDILALEKEVVLRYYALLEIYESKKLFLSHNRKNVIWHGAQILLYVYNALASQKVGLYMGAKSFVNLATSSNPNEFSNEDRDEAILRKQKHLKGILNALNIESVKNDDILREMAQAEKTLEQFALDNASQIDEICAEIEAIANADVTNNNKDELLKKINELIPLAQVFGEYGHIQNMENALWILYWQKFDIQTHTDGFYQIAEPFDIESMDPLEKEYYKEIVFHRYNSYMESKCSKFKDYFGSDYADALNALKNLIFDEKHEFNAERILKNKFLLNLFIYFLNDKINVEFYLNLMQIWVLKDDFDNSIFHESIFTWQDKVPMETIFRLLMLNGIAIESDFYRLWDKHKSRSFDSYYLMLDGLKYIDLPDQLSEEDKDFIQKIRWEVNGKYVVMPSGLEVFNGDLFGDIKLKGISFKEGLIALGNYSLRNQALDELALPSTLRFIRFLALNEGTNSIILNYINYQLQLSEDALINLFRSVMTSKCNRITKMDSDGRKYGYDLFLRLKNIQIFNNGEFIANFNGNEFTCETWVDLSYFYTIPDECPFLTDDDVNKMLFIFKTKVDDALDQRDNSKKDPKR